MDQTEVRRLIAASWLRFADEVRPGTWDQIASNERAARDATATAAQKTAEDVIEGLSLEDVS